MYPDNYLEEVLKQQIMEEMNSEMALPPRSSKICKDVITKEDRNNIRAKHVNDWMSANDHLAKGFKDSITVALGKFYDFPHWDTNRKLTTLLESYSRIIGNAIENAIDEEIDELRLLREAAL